MHRPGLQADRHVPLVPLRGAHRGAAPEDGPVTREDWRQMARDIPAALVVLLGLLAFMALIFAVVPGP